MKPVDDCPVSVSPMTAEVRRDLKQERDDEAYFAMCKAVYDEMEVECAPWRPDGHAVHKEALRRLRNG